MTTQQTEAIKLAERCEHGYPLTGDAISAAAELRRQHARITELESQLAQRFGAADMATAAAQGFRDGVASVSAQADDLRATFSEMLVDLPNTEPYTLFQAGFDAALAAGQATAAPVQPAAQQAGEYPALVCDYCGALTPDPWHSSGMLHGKMSKHIHSCDACAARGAARAQEDAALWHWLAEYLVGTRTDLDDEIVASETVNDLRKLVKAAIKQGASHDNS